MPRSNGPAKFKRATVGQMTGLVTLPMIASVAMTGGGWRAGWMAIGMTVLIVGFVPVFLLMVRRPEDLGLIPDGGVPASGNPTGATAPEPAFTRAEALRTRSFWMLSLFTLLAYPVQAGVSLHQAPFLIERGLSPTAAASIVSYFSLMSGIAGFGFGLTPRWVTVRWRLAAVGVLLSTGTVMYFPVHGIASGYAAATFFGFGIGGLLIMLPVAWADYFGRRSYGAIRGIALTVQVLAQAIGPILSGVLRDITHGYETSLACFAVLSVLSALAAILAIPPDTKLAPVAA